MVEAKDELRSDLLKESSMDPIVHYLNNSKELEDKNQARKLQIKVARYTLLDGGLYKNSFSGPLLRCVTKEKYEVMLKSIHLGVCGNHSGGRSLAHKALTTGYFWPYMMQDAQDFAKKCKKCQKHGPLIHQPSEFCNSVVSPFLEAGFGYNR